MSTRARLGIGPAKAALLRNLKEAANIITVRPQGNSEEELKEFYDTQTIKLEEKVKRITDGVSTLQRINEEWLKEIEGLSGDKEQAAEAKYSQMAADEDGMLNLIERAKDDIATFKVSIADMQRISTKYQGPRVETPTSPLPPRLSVSSIKLPKITLPEFHGDPKEWSSFWSAFEAAVDSQHIPTIQKLVYLKGCLKGVAKEAVAGFRVQDENYDEVLKTLRRRFADEEIIRRALHQELKQLKEAQSVKELRANFEVIERVIRELNNLGEECSGMHFELLIEEKLPRWALSEIYDKKEKEDGWNLKKLRATIDNILKKREAINKICEDRSGHGFRAERPVARRPHTKDWSEKFPERGTWRSGGKSKEAGTSSRAEENWRKYHASTIVAVKNENKEKGRKPCAFCKGEHWNNQCTEYPDVKSRTKRAVEANLCFNCLGTGHLRSNCKLARQNCYDCKGNHNTALCPQTRKEAWNPMRTGRRVQSYSNPQATAMTCDERETDKNARRQEKTMIGMAGINTDPEETRNVTLLMCKELTIINPNNKRRMKVLAFFDTGSQRSYIEDTLANELGLWNDKIETLEISGFGSKTSTYKSQRVVIAVVLQDGSNHPMEVNTMETMTAKIPSVEIKDTEALLDAKQFDLGTGCWKKPRLLIGVDQYFHLITSQEIEKLPSGYLLIQSMVGPIIMGKGAVVSGEANSRTNDSRAIVVTGIEHDVERIWANQCQKEMNEERERAEERPSSLQNQLKAQQLIITKLEEKDKLLTQKNANLERQLRMVEQAVEVHKRRARECSQSSADFNAQLEKCSSQLNDAKQAMISITSQQEVDAFKIRRLEEDENTLKKRFERPRKLETGQNCKPICRKRQRSENGRSADVEWKIGQMADQLAGVTGSQQRR